jgi:hypothetical protein
MKFRRTPPPPTRRQRLQADTDLSQSPPAFSYRSSRRSPQETTPTRTKIGHFWLQRFGLIILLLAVGVSTINVLSLSTTAKILPLGSDSSQVFLRDQAVYGAAADQLLKSSIWNRDKITVNTAQVRQSMLKQFPELTNVSITLPLLAHRPLVYVEAAQPILVLVNASGAFIIDATGKALLQAANQAALDQPQLPVLHDQSGLKITVNRQALPADDVSFIQIVLAELATRHFTAAALTLPAAASELDVQIAGQPYFVKFNLETNTPREQAGTFLATITQLQRQNTLPAKYVDVRVDGRAYYQ